MNTHPTLGVIYGNRDFFPDQVIKGLVILVAVAIDKASRKEGRA